MTTLTRFKEEGFGYDERQTTILVVEPAFRDNRDSAHWQWQN
jgi:hypothetical protein